MKNKKNNIPILILLTILLVGSQFGCVNFKNDPELKFSNDKIAEIDHVIETLFGNNQFSGTVLVSVKGKVIYKNAVGYANIKDSILNTCDTKFRIASFTKPFTAMLILQLVEDGVIELEGKLTKYLPEFTVKGGEKITIDQLLTHTAGITGESRIPNLIDIEKLHYSREELLDCIMNYALVYTPGKDYEYSNFGFAILGLVIEKVTGKTYDEVIYEKICKPAGMKNTFSDVTDQTIENRAIGYTYDYFSGLEKSSYLNMSFCLGSGQLLSTVEDLYLFDKALYTNKFLSEESKDLFFNKYGWRTVKYPYGKDSKRILSNNLEGSINGFQSHTQRIGKDSVLIVALRNVKEAVYENQIVIKWPSAIASPILSILYNEEYNLTKKSGAFEVFKTLIESGQAESEKKYYEIIDTFQDKYYINENEFVFFKKELINKNMDTLANEYVEIRIND